MALISSPCPLRVWQALWGDGNINDFHYSPDYVKDGRKNDAYEQENERIVENALYRWNFLRRLNFCGFFTHDP